MVHEATSVAGIVAVNREERFEFTAERGVDYALEFDQTLHATATGSNSVASADLLGTTDAVVSETPFPSTTTTTSTTVTSTTSTTTTSTLPPPCGPAPDAACLTPVGRRAALLVIRDSPRATKDLLTLSWTKGAATSKSDFGAPTTVSDYAMCVWTDVATTPVLTMAAMAPAGGTQGTKPCWKETKSGFTYTDKALTPDGLLTLVLKGGAAGKAVVSVKGRGPSLSLPPPPLPLPVVVQVHRVDGQACWGATFAQPTRNKPGLFKARSE